MFIVYRLIRFWSGHNSYITQHCRNKRLVKEVYKMKKMKWITSNKNIIYTQIIQFICMHKWMKWIQEKLLLLTEEIWLQCTKESHLLHTHSLNMVEGKQERLKKAFVTSFSMFLLFFFSFVHGTNYGLRHLKQSWFEQTEEHLANVGRHHDWNSQVRWQKTFGSSSIKYRSDTVASDRYLIDIKPMLYKYK